MSNQVPTYAEFIAAFPAFSPPAVSESAIISQLNLAERLLSKGVWGDFYSDGILQVAAHNLTMWVLTQSSPQGGLQAATGNVTASSGAGITIAFESIVSVEGSKSDIWYNRTSYGQQYLYLRSIVVPCATLSF